MTERRSPASPLDEVGRLRSRIDKLDLRIVELLKSRYENARELGRLKRTRGIALRDPRRESRILTSTDRLASRMNLDPRRVRGIFRQIFAMSLRSQRDRSTRRRVLAGYDVLVVGGTGGMGGLFSRVFAGLGATVTIAGRNLSRTERVASQIGVDAGTYRDAATADIVMVGVPLQSVERVSIRVANYMADGNILVDISSVKAGICDNIAANIHSGVEYVSLHPLFGPDVDHLYGQRIIAVPYRTGRSWQKLLSALKSGGASIILSSAQHHDRTMAYVQGLHHFALISLGASLARWTGEYPTNSLRITADRIQTVLENWDTVVGIQRLNPYVPRVRKQFGSVVNELSSRNFEEADSLFELLRSNARKWTRKQ